MKSKPLQYRLLASCLALSAGFLAIASNPGTIAAESAFPSGGPTPTPPPNPAQPLWVDAKTANNIVYFAFGGTAPHLERFHMQSETWLPPIALSDVPTAFAVDGTGIYASFGRRTARLALDGTGETHLVNTVANVTGAVIRGDHLFLVHGSQFNSVNKATGTLQDAKSFSYVMVGLSVAPTKGKIFGRSTGVSPSDIIQLTLQSTGALGVQTDSPYHGSYPSATRTYVFPNDSKVADNAGIIYNTTDLTYVNSYAGAFTDLDFSGDRSVVLRSNTLIGYSNTFLETGRYPLAGTPLRIFVSGDSVFSFYQGATRGVFEVKTALAAIVPGAPGEPIDPTNLAYTPDAVVAGDGGVIYLLSRANFSIFRWSLPLRRYLPTIPLIDAPTYIAYSSINRALYLAYPGGGITRITPESSLSETPFANLPQRSLGLSTAGEYVFACDQTGPWVTHYTFRPDGTLRSSKNWNYYSTEYIWSAANRKMYHFRDDTSPNDLLAENIAVDGAIGTTSETPYHGDFGFIHPIRVKPDGTVVVVGSGVIFDANTLTQINSLSNNISDGDWLNGNLFTIAPLGSETRLQAWSSSYAISATLQLTGTPKRLLTMANRLVAITLVSGRPTFTVFDANLNVVSPVPRAEFTGDVQSDIIWQNNSAGYRGIWLMNGTEWAGERFLPTIPVEWQIATSADFNDDGHNDLVWQNLNTGARGIWLMNESSWVGERALPTIPTDWQIKASGDFNGDGHPDLLWQNSNSGVCGIWLMNGISSIGERFLPTVPIQWQIAGADEFDGDGQTDILWENVVTGERGIWLMHGTTLGSVRFLPTIPTEWRMAGTGEFNGDGKADIVWQNTANGQRGIWLMDGTTWIADRFLPTIPLEWEIRNH